VLHTPVNFEEVVDSEAAREFMKEATKVATGTELEGIGERLEMKSRVFRELLAEDRLAALDEEGLQRLLSRIFSLRRKAGRLVRQNSLERLRDEFRRLLYGPEGVAGRFDRFVEQVEGLDKGMVVSLASETLHFADPRRYWLWTHWIWNPDTGKGALALVTQESVDLAAETDGGVYAKVGEAMASVDAMGHAVGYSRSGRGLFGTDIFLACVYAVYMFTVFRVKLSQEFNRILPELPELAERVLGVHGLGEPHGS